VQQFQVTLAEREVSVAGERVRYRVGGNGPPVVLVHGLAGSTRWWEPTLPPLLEGHRVHLVDLPGFGAMARRGRRLALDDAAAWLGAWGDAIGLGSTVVVGHSMGAIVALDAAATRPDLVRGLVLVAPAGLAAGRRTACYAVPLAVALARSRRRFLFVLARDAVRAGPSMVWRAARDVVASDLRKTAAKVSAPTLLVFGSRDALAPPALGKALATDLRSAETVVLEGAGHVPMYDRPDDFNAALLSFLARR
jgi:pimeloyl-ACP methyl ester carboxylesterase